MNETRKCSFMPEYMYFKNGGHAARAGAAKYAVCVFECVCRVCIHTCFEKLEQRFFEHRGASASLIKRIVAYGEPNYATKIHIARNTLTHRVYCVCACVIRASFHVIICLFCNVLTYRGSSRTLCWLWFNSPKQPYDLNENNLWMHNEICEVYNLFSG